MSEYNVKLTFPENSSQEFKCNMNDYILDRADELGIDLPYSCRAGACSTCAGIILGGTINQDDQSFLNEKDINNGFVLTCVASPLTDCHIKTHMEESLYD